MKTKKTTQDTTSSTVIRAIQDLKGFMVENFASKSDLKGLNNNLEEFRAEVKESFATKSELKTFSDKTQSNFENVFSRLDTLETENGLGTLHARELKVQVEDHAKRLKIIESAKN